MLAAAAAAAASKRHGNNWPQAHFSFSSRQLPMLYDCEPLENVDAETKVPIRW